MKFKSLVLAFFLVSNSNSVFAQTPEEGEVLTWSYTELGPIWIKGGLSQEYCKKNLRYFRGCFASLNMLVQQINPNHRLYFKSEKQEPSPVDSTEHLSIVNVGAPVAKFFPQQEREFWSAERERYKKFVDLDIQKISSEIEELASKLLAQKESWLPYQIARVINTASTYTYDPQTSYYPTFRYNATPVAVPKPTPGFRLEQAPQGWVVQRVYIKSSARKEGVRRGDFVESIDGRAIAKLDANTVDNLLTKPKDSKIRIVINRDGQRLTKSLTMNFDFPYEMNFLEMIYLGQRYAYLSLENTHNTASAAYCSHVAKELLRVEKEHRGLILDVRGQSSEQHELVTCLAGFLIGSKQEVFAAQSIIDPAQIHKAATSSKTLIWKPVVILQDEATEGSFELLSGSLQLAGRAYVIGKMSKGSGTEQAISQIYRVDRFETAYLFYLPNGESHHNKGITPNFEINRHEQPNYYEKYALKMSEFGVFPIVPGKIAPLNFQMGKYPLNENCRAKQDVLTGYRSLPDQSEEKDMHIQSALAVLYCSDKASL